MAIETQVWLDHIQEKLYPDDSFLNRSVDESEYVENKTVNRPEEGGTLTVVKNGTPTGAIASVTDVVNSYNIDYYRTPTTKVESLEEIETSYNKRNSLLKRHYSRINEYIGSWTAFNWAPDGGSSFVIRTTGASRDAMHPGATGQRKKIQLQDFTQAKRILDAENIPMDGRYVLLPSEMYNDLFEIPQVISHHNMGTQTLPDGVVAKLMGFNVIMRSYTVAYSNAATPVKQNPFTTLTTANATGLFWHEDFVGFAKGQTEVFMTEKSPQHYGDIFSAQGRAGGKPMYTNGKGVVALVEAAA